MTTDAAAREPQDEPAPYADVWVVLPTYDEADNLPGISRAILEPCPARPSSSSTMVA